MAQNSIPVDLFNPGQVFACLGFLEAANVLLGDAQGGFDWTDPVDVRFRLQAPGGQNPIEGVLAFLAEATVSARLPRHSELSTKTWKLPTILSGDAEFPFPEPDSPATLPAVLAGKDGTTFLEINHWGEAASRTKRDAVKFWAGAGGLPGSAVVRNILNLVRERLKDASTDPFALSAPQSSGLRFDWRRDYIPIDTGFSPNKHKRTLTMLGYPVVDILGAVGLSNARPEKLKKLEYRYAAVGVPNGAPLLDLIFLRAALGCADMPFQCRTFRMKLDWPGKENQARCITTVLEETPK